MAAEDKKITVLPAATVPLAGNEKAEIVQGGINVQVDVSEFGGGGGGAVDSVNGQTGVVVLDATDVGADPAGSASAVNTALSNHISDAADAHAGTAITNTPTGNIAATTVQAAINELDSEKQSAAQVQAIADAKVADAINDGTTTVAPSQNAVFDALADKMSGTITEVSITGAITLDATAFGKVHICTGTSTNYTIGLPTAVGNTGKSITFKCSPLLTVLVTLDGNGSQTIDGALTDLISTKSAVTLLSDGSNWLLVSQLPSIPVWLSYDSSINPTGFLSTTVKYCRYHDDATAVHIIIGVQGTSNATTFTLTLPISLNAFYGASGLRYIAFIINNTVNATGRVLASGSGNTLTVEATVAGGAFAAAGLKGLFIEFTYLK